MTKLGRFDAQFHARGDIDAAERLKSIGEFTCPKHGIVIQRGKLKAVADGEALVPVESCCYDAVIAFERKLNNL